MTAARDYLRVSEDRRGVSGSRTQQHVENVAGWPDLTFGPSYGDTGSASRYRSRDRDDFERLCADLRAGRFGAEVLVLWELSRGSRDVDEWLSLMALLVKVRVKVAVTIDHRLYDPNKPGDRRQLIIDAAEAEYASALTSERVSRNNRASAKQGRPHGKVPYGYRRTYDPDTREARQVENPAEAAHVRELFDRLAAGHSLKAIARDWFERGITSRGSPKMPARPFSCNSLRTMALCPSYAGLRSHRPGGRKGGNEAVVIKGTWDGLVSVDRWQRVRRMLVDPRRRTSRPGRGVHLMSRIARCGVCDDVLGAGYRKGDREVREYACINGHVRCNADDLDEYATGRMLAYLSDIDEWEATFGGDDYEARAVPIKDEIALIDMTLADLYASAERSLNLDALKAMAPGLAARRADAQRRLDALAAPLHLMNLIEPGRDVLRRWVKMEMPARREVARMLLGEGGRLGTLRLGPAPNRQACPMAERLTVTGGAVRRPAAPVER